MLDWSYLVHALHDGFYSVLNSMLRLLRLFVTPFGDIISNDTGISSWVTSLIDLVLSMFGVSFLQLTPLQFMLGSTIPIIVVFTIYRYVKQ